MDDPYYEFRRYCTIQFNIYHRLKYVTNTIVKTLQNPKYGGVVSLIGISIPPEADRPTCNVSGLIFSDYQKAVHCQHVKEKPMELHLKKKQWIKLETKQQSKKSNKAKRCCGGCCKQRKEDGLYSCCQKFKRSSWLPLETDDNEIDIGDILKTKPLEMEFEGQDENISTTITNRLSGSLETLEHASVDDIYGSSDSQTSFMHRRRRGISFAFAKPIFDIMPIQEDLEEETIIKRNRYTDPFLQRNAKIELLETFQCFNLLIYGVPLAQLIIKQLQSSNRDAYYDSLGILLAALPYSVALSLINKPEIKGILRNTEPERLEMICEQLLQNSLFQTVAALDIANFFDDLLRNDAIRTSSWKQLSEKFEMTAFREMMFQQSDSLLFLLLIIPLTQINGKSLLQFALEHQRFRFLNNDGIQHAVNHLYQNRYLGPEDDVSIDEWDAYKMLQLIVTHPFKFYLSARGYQWISGILFMLYFGFVCFYAYMRPFTGKDLSQTDIVIDSVLWIMNTGYILYEIIEFTEKSVSTYLIKGQSNTLDVIISLMWIVLFSIRMHLVISESEFKGNNASSIQSFYVFLFGLQIILLTFRALQLLSSSESFGVLVKAIALMLKPIVKILFIFIIAISGFLFALWTIASINKCEYNDESDGCDDYEAVSLWRGAVYVFEVFIGTGDLSGTGQAVDEEPFAILLMIMATIFGTIILTNLLIALMTTEYENVAEKAKSQVIYNKTELAFDLSKRSRLMPPPLNIFVLAIALIVDLFNFIFAMIHPSWNIYAQIDHQLFFNLQNFHICHWEHDENKWRPVRGNETKYKTRRDIIAWYFQGWWYDWIRNVKCSYRCCLKAKKKTNDTVQNENDEDEEKLDVYWRIHHKACYGLLILHTHGGETYNGITMSQYLERYENKQRQKIETQDKQLLKQLTANTLFCEYCYTPFEKNKVYKELTTAYAALLDYISALMFVIIPVAYIPMLLLFGCLSLVYYCLDKLDDSKDKKKSYKHTDFDKEYFANQFHAQ
eukprot:9653_1